MLASRARTFARRLWSKPQQSQRARFVQRPVVAGRLLVGLALMTAGCPAPSDTSAPKNHESKPLNTSTISDDAMARPTLAKPKTYQAPEPQVYTTPQGMTVWLVERPAVPVVSVSVTLRRGSADDPPGKEGLAHIATGMMDEGAGNRNAIQIAEAIDELGASMWGGSSVDGSHMTLSVVKKQLGKAFGIFADVVARPSFDKKEFERATKLWRHRLKKRADNPEAVASLVARAVGYGPDTPYGHPASGRNETAESLTLEDAKQFYQNAWRPDQAMMLVAGAITRSELDALIEEHLGDWKAPEQAPAPAAELTAPLAERPRLVMVDRPDAPQTVIAVVGEGVTASSEAAPLLELINTALGGSFTSRLNQNLREDRGWTYGVRSAFTETRGQGLFVVRTAVETAVTGAAVAEIIKEIDKMAEFGLSDNEYGKVRARDLTETIETHETAEGLVGRLSHLAMMGMPVDFDARASAARQAARKASLTEVAKRYLNSKTLSIVLVGPQKEVAPQLEKLDLPAAVHWTVEGFPAAKNTP